MDVIVITSDPEMVEAEEVARLLMNEGGDLGEGFYVESVSVRDRRSGLETSAWRDSWRLKGGGGGNDGRSKGCE